MICDDLIITSSQREEFAVWLITSFGISNNFHAPFSFAISSFYGTFLETALSKIHNRCFMIFVTVMRSIRDQFSLASDTDFLSMNHMNMLETKALSVVKRHNMTSFQFLV